MDRKYTVVEVANLFGVSRTTVYAWMKSGDLKYLIRKQGKKTYRDIQDSALREFAEVAKSGKSSQRSLDLRTKLDEETSAAVREICRKYGVSNALFGALAARLACRYVAKWGKMPWIREVGDDEAHMDGTADGS